MRKTPRNPKPTFMSILRLSAEQARHLVCTCSVIIVHRNIAQGYYNADRMMIEQCPIIPSKQHGIYANGVEAELLEDLHDLRSPKYLLDSAMCYAELKIIMQNTSAETCINKFHKICNVCAAYKKLRLMFLGPSFTQRCMLEGAYKT